LWFLFNVLNQLEGLIFQNFGGHQFQQFARNSGATSRSGYARPATNTAYALNRYFLGVDFFVIGWQGEVDKTKPSSDAIQSVVSGKPKPIHKGHLPIPPRTRTPNETSFKQRLPWHAVGTPRHILPQILFS
jgi:hypothetical protein